MATMTRPQPVWASFLAALLAGIALGAGVNIAEHAGVPGASDFGNYFGLWVVTAALVAAWSHSLQRAILNTVIFLLGMVGTYYLSTLLLAGYLLTHLVVAWSAVALLLAPPFAAIVWHARGSSWRSALATAVPVGLLLYEAYGLRWVIHIHATQVVFNIVAAVALLLILPRDLPQRLRVVALTPVVMLGAGTVMSYAWDIVAWAM